MFGIIAARGIFGGELEVILVSLLILCLSCGFFIFHKSFKPAIAILIFFLIGNGFYFIGASTFNTKTYNSQVAVVGRVSDDITHYDYSTVVVLDDVSINGEDSKNLRLTITNAQSDKIKVGDILTFEANVENSKAFTLKSFNSKDYRSGVRYSATVKFDNIVFSSGGKKIDETIRTQIKQLIYSNMNEDNAAIAYAVMFGDKSDLDGEIYSAYQNSGIIHVLTVSGLHVGFLVSLFYGLMKKCGVNNIANLCITSVILLAYAFLCNFSPSVVRAGVMAFCMMLARALHRKYDSLNALGLAGFILCLIKPLTALDTGFLMSFFCVFAILMINPSLTRLLSHIFPFKISTLISLSLSAQLGILPIIASMGGTLNLLSFVVNIIVVPVFGVIYPFLFVICLLGSFMPFMGIFLHAVNFVLSLINSLATFFSHSSLTISLSSLGFAVTIVFFLIIFLSSRYYMVDFVKKFICFSVSVLLISITTCCYALPIAGETSVDYLSSYGQTCVVITSKSGQTAVVGNNNMLSRYQNAYSAKLDAYFSFSALSDEEISDLSGRGISKFISCAPYSDRAEGEDTVEVNTNYTLSDMEFVYLSASEGVLGLIIIVDNRTIFVAKEGNLDYTLYEKHLESYQPEIVVAGKKGGLSSDDYICLTYQKSDNGYSFEECGNFKVFFDGNNWIKRGLD